MHRIGDPDTCQVAGAVLARQLLRIAPIGFDAFSGLARDQARSDDHATMAEAQKLPIDAIAAAASFIAELQPASVFR